MKRSSSLKVIIFSYQREIMLRSVVKLMEDNTVDYHVIDDGSDFDLWDFIPGDRFSRFNTGEKKDQGGKRHYWKRFEYAFSEVKHSKADNFMFMPDDFERLDLVAVWALVHAWKDKKYVVNLINDGRSSCWGEHSTGIKPIEFLNTKLVECGFCDCGFITSRKSLLDIHIDPVPPSWFEREDMSSGVGYQLTNKFRRAGIPMLKPLHSLAYHGTHESKMHGEHRNETPLISI